MARRRRHEEEHENHERWLVSYADFITLLFAFFVVMYAISQINEGKYRVLSSSIIEAFRSGNLAIQATPPSGGANTMIEIPDNKPIARAVKNPAQIQTNQKLRDAGEEIARALGPMIESGQVKVRIDEGGIYIEIKDTALFPVGQAAPSAASVSRLGEVAHILSGLDNAIRVEGFTDNMPIRNAFFPSNWELSAARAGSIVRLFQENGVAPERLVAVGRGENQPVADNDSDEGRAKNRRVAITVQADTNAAAPSGIPSHNNTP